MVGVIGVDLAADERETRYFTSLEGNAWLEEATHEDGCLRLRVGLRLRLRGAERGLLRINRADNSEVTPQIAPAQAKRAPGRFLVDYVVPASALVGDAAPGSLGNFSLWLTIEFGEERRARIAFPSHLLDVPVAVPAADRVVLLRRTGSGDLGLRVARRTGSIVSRQGQTGTGKRVMIFANQINFGGGKTKAIFQLARELAIGGHDVRITALWFDGRESRYAFPESVGFDFIDGDYRCRGTDGKPGSSRFCSVNKNMTHASDVRLALYLMRNRFDLIYLPNYDSPMYRLIRDLVPNETVLLLGDHHPSRAERIEKGSPNPDFVYAVRTFDAVHTVNPLIRDVIQTLTDKQIFTIPNMVDKGAAIRRDDAFFATRKLVSIGRLTGTKRMDHAIKAFALLAADFPEWTLDIFGSGADMDALRGLIVDLGLEGRATMRGFDSQVVEIMAEGAVFVSASAAEAHPLVTIEAMVAGCPVISYDKQYGSRYLVQDEETGFLAAEGEIDALAARIADVFRMVEGRNPALLDVIARAGESTTRFARKAIADQWLAKVEELCAAKQPAPVEEPAPPAPSIFRRFGRARP